MEGKEQEAWLGRAHTTGHSLKGRLGEGDEDDSLWMESFAPETATEGSLTHLHFSSAAAASQGMATDPSPSGADACPGTWDLQGTPRPTGMTWSHHQQQACSCVS